MPYQIVANDNKLPRILGEDTFKEVISLQTDILKTISNQFDSLKDDFAAFLSFDKSRAKREEQLYNIERNKEAEAALENKTSFMGKSSISNTFEDIKGNIVSSGNLGKVLSGVLGASALAYFGSSDFKEFIDGAFSIAGDMLTSDIFKKGLSEVLGNFDWVTLASYFVFGFKGVIADIGSKLAVDAFDVENGPLKTAIEYGIKGLALGALLFPATFWKSISKTIGAIGRSVATNTAKMAASINPQIMVSEDNRRVETDSKGQYRVARGEKGAGQFVKQAKVRQSSRIGQLVHKSAGGKTGMFVGAATAIAGTIASLLHSSTEEVERQGTEAIETYEPQKSIQVATNSIKSVGMAFAEGAMTGGMAGSLFFGPAGAAIGAGVGGLLGATMEIISLSDNQISSIKKLTETKWNGFIEWISNQAEKALGVFSLPDIDLIEMKWDGFSSRLKMSIDNTITAIIGIFDNVIASLKKNIVSIADIHDWLVPDNIEKWAREPNVTHLQSSPERIIPQAIVPTQNTTLSQAITGATTTKNKTNLQVVRGGDTNVTNNYGVGVPSRKQTFNAEPQNMRSLNDPFAATHPLWQ